MYDIVQQIIMDIPPTEYLFFQVFHQYNILHIDISIY